MVLLKFIVFFIRHRFQPLIRSILTGNFESKMGKPTIRSGTVPMLHICRDMDNRTGRISTACLPSS